ncbi:Aste57867_8079 [Aphanomyces stellatus]|uniref:Aste57867_8079 protein n=1 Tax=Aphanomyces stellatus TaxID=120398 RepID=A0A485KJC4_9STRA|nr:hypothetical protein As57867_008049 [Aphanomyces stellatus]VFT84968.1 Aste57867_8079 [Aphanomyces stellatus]
MSTIWRQATQHSAPTRQVLATTADPRDTEERVVTVKSRHTVLVAEQVHVIVFDISLPRTCHPAVTFVRGNLLHKDHVQAALTILGDDLHVQSVFHMASLIPFMEVPDKAVERVNFDGTRVLLDVCQASKTVSSFIYTSSATLTEDVGYPSEHLDTYTQTKVAAERLVLAANNQTTQFATCALRPTSMFGRRDKILSDGLRALECVAVAHRLVLDALRTPAGRARVGGQAYFVGNDEEKTFGWFLGLDTDKKASGISHWNKPVPMIIPLWLVHVLCFVNDTIFQLSGVVVIDSYLTASLVDYTQRTYTFSSAKAKRDFGYVPLCSVKEKIRELATKAKTN